MIKDFLTNLSPEKLNDLNIQLIKKLGNTSLKIGNPLIDNLSEKEIKEVMLLVSTELQKQLINNAQTFVNNNHIVASAVQQHHQQPPLQPKTFAREINETSFKQFNNTNKVHDVKLVEVSGVSKSFGNQSVLKDISLDIYDGETLAIIGHNGAGKTVFSEILAGLIVPNNGQMIFNFDNYKKEIGMQFQDSEIKGNYNALDLINFYKLVYHDKDIKESEISEMLKIFKINDFKKKKISKLSGGQKQRINLMLAIMSKPRLMILDEFITGLDITSVVDILEYINRQKEETKATLIIISHQPEEIKMLADRVALFKDGVVKSIKTVNEILSENSTMTEYMVGVL